jgi:hypothetical protein
MSRLRWVPVSALVLGIVVVGAAFLAGGMARVVAWYLLDLVPFVAVPMAIVVLGVAAVRRRVGPATRVTLAACVLGSLPLLKTFQIVPLAFPASLDAVAPSLTVRLPSDQPLLVVWGGDALETNRHVTEPAQRWAYDLVVRPALSGESSLEAYGCWGTPVLAPAAGAVVRVVDGLPDHPPAVPSNDALTPCGNHVALRVEATGTVLILCHLQRGSIAVTDGAAVAEGAVVGRCGNSGNTSEPHIHVHHQRELPPEGVFIGEGLPLYFRGHDGAPMPIGGVREVDGVVEALGDTVRHRGGGASAAPG